MANKQINDLQLRSSADATCNIPTDDASQTWRVTLAQIKTFILGTGDIGTTQIAANAVTFAKLQTLAAARMMGNITGGAAVPTELTAAQVLTFLGISTGSRSDWFGHSPSGYGSTNTNIRKGFTQANTTGSAITYADSATLGSTWTINETGLYTIDRADRHSAVAYFGISVNGVVATGITSLTYANGMRGSTEVGGANTSTSMSRTLLLTAADVVRCHDTGAMSDNSSISYLAITKISA